MTPETITAIVTTIGSIAAALIAAYFGWKSKQRSDQIAEHQNMVSERQEFTKTLIERVDTLESRVDDLGTQVIDNLKTFEDEKRKIANESEQRIDSLRTEMRRLIENKDIEIATWRDRYFKVVEEYNALKLSTAELQIKLMRLQADYDQLQKVYQDRIHTTGLDQYSTKV